MGKSVYGGLEYCKLAAPWILRRIAETKPFITAAHILFQISTDTAHTGKPGFPGIVFSHKDTYCLALIV